MVYKDFQIVIRALDIEDDEVISIDKELKDPPKDYKFVVLDADSDDNCVAYRFDSFYDTIEEAIAAIDTVLSPFPAPLELTFNSGETACMISGVTGPSLDEAERFVADILEEGEHIVSIILLNDWDICASEYDMKVNDYKVFERSDDVDDNALHVFDIVKVLDLDSNFKNEHEESGFIIGLTKENDSTIVRVFYDHIGEGATIIEVEADKIVKAVF